MRYFHIYHSIGKDRFQEIEDQYREYVSFVEANSLEEAFEYAQNDHVDWAMNEVRSTSVGDVIESDEGFYMVCGMGFRLLDVMSKNESDLNSLESATYEG